MNAVPSTSGALLGRRGINWALAFAAFGVCAGLTFLFGFDVPYWDQWWKLEMIEKAFEGTLRVGDMWTTINEHRVFFPNLLTVPLARLTHWDLRFELGLNLLFGGLAFGVFAMMVLRAERATGTRGSLWVFPCVAVMMFSMNQHGVWMWGLHVMIAMTLFFLLAMLYVLTTPVLSWKRLAIAVSFAVGAGLSFGAGVVAWPTGLLALLMRLELPRRRRFQMAASWCVAALVAMGVYFIGYDATSANQSALTNMTSGLLGFVLYFLAYLGAPVFSFSAPIAVVGGLFGVSGFVWMARDWWRERTRHESGMSAWFLLGALAVFVGFLTGLKQSQEGIEQALSSRYLTWPTLLWAGILGRLYLSRDMSRGAVRILVAVLLVCSLLGSAYGAYRAEERHDAFLLGRQALIEGRQDADLLYLYPEMDTPVRMREILVRHRLTVFREPGPSVGE